MEKKYRENLTKPLTGPPHVHYKDWRNSHHHLSVSLVLKQKTFVLLNIILLWKTLLVIEQ